MKYLHFFLLIFCSNTLFSQNGDLSIKAIIDFELKNNVIIFSPKALNTGIVIGDLNYLFLVVKQNVNGNLNNSTQEGKFVIKSNEKLTLSESNINFSKNDKIKAYLFIRDEFRKELISKDSLVITLNDSLLEEYQVVSNTNEREFKSDQFIIKGLVSDHTKTKIGRDFFDIFYSSYNLSTDKFPFLIEIIEMPSMGRNSLINIVVEDNIIYSFRLDPSEEFLRMVNYELYRILYSYNLNRNIIKTY